MIFTIVVMVLLFVGFGGLGFLLSMSSTRIPRHDRRAIEPTEYTPTDARKHADVIKATRRSEREMGIRPSTGNHEEWCEKHECYKGVVYPMTDAWARGRLYARVVGHNRFIEYTGQSHVCLLCNAAEEEQHKIDRQNEEARAARMKVYELKQKYRRPVTGKYEAGGYTMMRGRP